MLVRLRGANQLDFSRAVIDTPPGFAGGTPTHVRAAPMPEGAARAWTSGS